MKKIFYDLGANRGQNLSYYLSSADQVIAVEANPVLAKEIAQSFSTEIEVGRLVIVNKCLAEDANNGLVDFYVHKYDSGLSRFIRPKRNPEDYEVISVGSISFPELVTTYGMPEFVKVDLEGYDKILLADIIERGLLPGYLSYENCGRDILERLIATNVYKRFNIVSFYNFRQVYGATTGKTAGPFGQDVVSPWLDSTDIMKLYDRMPSSWFDIHATQSELPRANVDFRYYQMPFDLILKLKKLVPHRMRMVIKGMLAMATRKSTT